MTAARVGKRARALLPRVGVHRGAVALLCGHGLYCRFGDGLALLHEAAAGEVDFGIAIPGEIAPLAERLGIREGAAVAFGDGAVLFPESGARLLLAPLLDAGAYTPAVHLPPPADLVRRTAAAGRLLDRAADSGGLCALWRAGDDRPIPAAQNPFCRAAAPALGRLLVGVAAANPAAVGSALDRLLGLGVGLTPSADDLLAGMLLAGHWLDRAGGERWGGMALLRQMVPQKAAALTTTISAAYLYTAASGGRYAPADEAAAALLSPAPAPAPALERLMALGGSSGKDLLAGILLAFRLWSRSAGQVRRAYIREGSH